MPRPVIFWFRRDLRLSDHPGLSAAAAEGPVIPLFILDEETRATGAAHRWRLRQSLGALADALHGAGSRLIFREGPALAVLQEVLAETGAASVHWTRCYDPASISRDARVKSELRVDGHKGHSHPGQVLFEPWTVKTGQGGYYRVFTPYWKAVRRRSVGAPLGRTPLTAPDHWPESLDLAALGLDRDMNRGGAVLARYATIGEDAAQVRLRNFASERLDRYGIDRDRLDRDGTSALSENLALGEISARACWFVGQRALMDGATGAETFLRELGWREFATHLIYHCPRMAQDNWRTGWDRFPWRDDNADAEAWRRGMTGEPVIDAAMRELYVTGRMHNRARMLVASYLTKHLLTDWRVGRAWFEQCLTDWDPASNAMGWQWVAGCGPDAAPYFRIFNPATQAEKFDPDGRYRARWLGAGASHDLPEPARDFFRAVPRAWEMTPDTPRPAPLIDLGQGRAAALAAYQEHKEPV